jgi:hypothetical protein
VKIGQRAESKALHETLEYMEYAIAQIDDIEKSNQTGV